MYDIESVHDVQDLMELLTTQEVIENQTIIVYLSQSLSNKNMHTSSTAKSIIEHFMQTNAPELNYQFCEVNVINKTIASKGEIKTARHVTTATRHYMDYKFQLSCWRI